MQSTQQSLFVNAVAPGQKIQAQQASAMKPLYKVEAPKMMASSNNASFNIPSSNGFVG